MRFGSIHFLWLWCATPLLIGFFIWAWQRRQAALSRFARLPMIEKLAPDIGTERVIVKRTMYVLFFVFLVFALARPRFGVKTEMIERKGVDIMVALDISRSMLAEDIAPNRLDRAKHEIGKFIDLLKGDRVGLIVFAGESFVQCPLTLDYGAAKMFLDVVSTEWIPLQGTALADAVDQAVVSFRSKAKKHKVLVILSDGEDHEGEAMEAARRAAHKGVRVYTVGIGSESGVPIPLAKSSGNVVYKKDKRGNLVMTRLNPLVLEKIALECDGKYFHAGTSLDLTRIYAEIFEMEKKDLGMNKVAIHEERYQLFLLIAIVLLLVEYFLSERVKMHNVWRGRFE